MSLFPLITGLITAATLHAAALVPAAEPPLRNIPAALEPNRGQANAEVLFLSRGSSSIAVVRDGVLLSPYRAKQQFEGSLPGGEVEYSGLLPGVANYYTGSSPNSGVTGVPRYRSARVNGIYAGVDAEYTLGEDGRLHLRLHLAAGVEPGVVGFVIAQSGLSRSGADGSLTLYFGTDFRLSPRITYPPPVAVQAGGAGTVARAARWEERSPQRFGVLVDGVDRTLPLMIEMMVNAPPLMNTAARRSARRSDGAVFVAAVVADAAGKASPFPGDRYDGCGYSIATPMACTDVALYKFNAQGVLDYVTYLAGRTSEQTGFLAIAPGGANGAVVLAGATNSPDFPSTSQALQPTYAGPAAALEPGSSSGVRGDLFAARVSAVTGVLLSSTFLGGPERDSFGAVALGPDGSLHLFHKWLNPFSAGMPTTRGALISACPGTPCRSAYAARLSSTLDQLLYGTYLPGTQVATGVLHSDGSLYFAGSTEENFPATPGVFQGTIAGGLDGMIGRLDPAGTRLLFATYLGTPADEYILRMAVAGDGSVWARVESEPLGLVHLDAQGVKMLANIPLKTYDLAGAPGGGVYVKAYGRVAPTAGAFLESSCGSGSYMRLNSVGETQFATYLPYWVDYDFTGISERGLPLLLGPSGEDVVVDEEANAGVYTGCVVDAASFANGDKLSPGSIVTLFGSQMGPREGAIFQLKDGQLPAELAGTQVFVNGDAIPLLYVSHGQINAVLPYTLPMNTRPEIQVVRPGAPGNVLKNSYVQRAGVAMFRLDDSDARPAAALNEDGSVNSASNPARPGSVVALFGTGGGATAPPSVAGTVTPLEARPLEYAPIVYDAARRELQVEYAGAAPGLVAGVIQINVRLPDPIPSAEGYPPGRAFLMIETRGATYYPGPVTVHVRQ